MVALVLAAGRPLAVRLRGGGNVCDSDALGGLVVVGGERRRWVGVVDGRRRWASAWQQWRSSTALGSLAALGGAISL